MKVLVLGCGMQGRAVIYDFGIGRPKKLNLYGIPIFVFIDKTNLTIGTILSIYSKVI